MNTCGKDEEEHIQNPLALKSTSLREAFMKIFDKDIHLDTLKRKLYLQCGLENCMSSCINV